MNSKTGDNPFAAVDRLFVFHHNYERARKTSFLSKNYSQLYYGGAVRTGRLTNVCIVEATTAGDGVYERFYYANSAIQLFN